MVDHLALLLYVHLHGLANAAVDFAVDSVVDAPATGGSRFARHDDRGQATTEYALVLLAAALVGLMVVAWATAGGGAQRISRLFNAVIDAVIDRV